MADNQGFDVKAYGKDLGRQMAHELLKLVAAEGDRFGVEFAEDLAVQVVRNMLATMIYWSISRKPLPGERPDQASVDNYRHMKALIQGAVADGFALAMARHNPAAGADYYCDVKLVPEPVNGKEA